jgi:hypothetical protein
LRYFRRLEPQITVGLLTDVRGFPLQIHAFTGNTAETKTIVTVISAFAAAHGLPEVTVVADAGMMSETNLKDLEDAGPRFIVGARIPDLPYQVKMWRLAHPNEPIPDGQIFLQPTSTGTSARVHGLVRSFRRGRLARTCTVMYEVRPDGRCPRPAHLCPASWGQPRDYRSPCRRTMTETR